LQEALDDPKFSVKNILKPLADLYNKYGDYDKELSCRQQIAAFYKKTGGAEYAKSLVKLGVTQHNLFAGGQAGNTHPEEGMQRAIEAFREALKIYTLKKFPVEYAQTMNNLGASYRDLPAGIAEKNLQKAIEAFKEALKIYTLKKFPVEYAQTMNNLGIACWELWAGTVIAQNENLQNAISAYKEALKIYNTKDFPVECAKTQYNLELAYRELPDDFNLN